MIKYLLLTTDIKPLKADINNDRKLAALPTLVSDVITGHRHYIDNLFASTWKN